MASVSQQALLATAGGPPVQEYSFVGSCISATTSLDFSSVSAGAVQAGDILVYIDLTGLTTAGPPSAVTPSGFTNHANTSASQDNEFRGMVSSKKAVGGEGAITGMSGTSGPGGLQNKIGLVFRPTLPFTTISANDVASVCFSSDPTAQVCDPSAESVAVIVIGICSILEGIAAFSTFSPAADAQIATASSDLRVGYKVYNSSPAATTIDQGDLGNDMWMASMYFKTA